MTGSLSNPLTRLRGHRPGPRPFIICQPDPGSLEDLFTLMDNEMFSCQVNPIVRPWSRCGLSQSNPHRERAPRGQPATRRPVLPWPCFQTLLCACTSLCILENVMNIKVSFPRVRKAGAQTGSPRSPGLVGHFGPRVDPAPLCLCCASILDTRDDSLCIVSYSNGWIKTGSEMEALNFNSSSTYNHRI